MKLIEELRQKHPTMAQQSDRGSRKAAIRLFCLTCYGGSAKEVRNCTSRDCPLYRFRLGIKEKEDEE